MNIPTTYRAPVLVLFALCTISVVCFSRQTADEPIRVTIIRPDVEGQVSRFPALVSHQEVKRPKVALVFSGGGSRGITAIGVLKTFEQAGIPIDYIVGTSMGSIIGGLYAAGYTTTQLQRMADTTQWDALLSFSDEARRRDLFYDQKLAEDRSILVVRFEGLEPIIPSAYSTGQTFLNYLNILTLQGIYRPGPSFDNLRIPFRAVATDLISGERVVIDRGDLSIAMKASMTVPLLFSPVVQDTMLLVDGGLVSNIPADVARGLGADIVIAVDATSPLRPRDKLEAAWEFADQIMGVMMKKRKEEELKDADIVITPALGEHLSTDFERLDWIIEQGERAAQQQLPRLQEVIHRQSHTLLAGRSSDSTYMRPVVRFDEQALGMEWSNAVRTFSAQNPIDEQEVRLFTHDLYESGEFQSVEFHVSTYRDSTVLQLDVRPNPALTSVEILGNNIVPPDTLIDIVTPLIRARLNVHAVTKAFEDLLGAYRDRGLSLARIREVTFDPSTGKAVIVIDEGVVHRRDIRGTVKTKDYIIWRELPWEQGEVFDVAQVATGIENLYGTNLFEFVSVNVHYEGENQERNIVTINVRERRTELIRLGLRADNERNIQPSLDIRDENLLGLGMELGARFYGGPRNRGLVGEFKATRIFDTYLTFNLKGYYEYKDVNMYGDEQLGTLERWNRVQIGEYRELRSGGSFAFGAQLERLGIASVEGRLETHRIWSISGSPFPTESFRFASLKFGTKLDTQDRFPFPRTGVSIDFFYESAFVKVTSNVGFTKMFFQYRNYETYFSRHTVSPRILFGFADETLPVTEQFSIGGQNNFFGLREDNARGRQLFIASLEYRYHSPVSMFFDTYLKVRYDFGSLWAAPEEIKLGDLRHGVGVSLALDTPIGPAEFSVGKSFFFRKDLLEHPVSVGPWVFYFSIGYAL